MCSTATGSTAHARSLGGSFVDPSLNVILVTAIASLGIDSRQVVLPATAEVAVSKYWCCFIAYRDEI